MNSLVCVQDFEDRALQLLDKNCRNYFKSGADDEITLRENQHAFARWYIRPRMLRNVSSRRLERYVLGKPVAFPVGIAPTAFQSLVHPRAEIESAKAAAKAGTVFVLSTYANWSIEDVAKEAPGGRKWFQLFPNSRKEVTKDLLRRAEAAGYEAIVVTLDAQNFGNKRALAREAFQLPQPLKVANLEQYRGDNPIETESLYHFVHSSLAQDLTWETIKWIQRETKLPIILKGILTREDAEIAMEHKVAGVWVSNHGGRQIDTTLPSVDALPQVIEAIKGKCEVYLDSGVRKGSDVFKAIALGATMVFVGRPTIWGVAVAGEEGAGRVLEILKDELDLTMALSGVANLDDLNSSYIIRHNKNYSKL